MAIWILWSFPVAGSTFHPHGFCEATNWWHSETVKLLPTLKHTNSDEILSRKYSKTTEVDQSLKCHEMAPKCCTGNISKYQTKNCSELPECPTFSLKVANAHGTSSANFGSREKVPCWNAECNTLAPGVEGRKMKEGKWRKECCVVLQGRYFNDEEMWMEKREIKRMTTSASPHAELIGCTNNFNSL